MADLDDFFAKKDRKKNKSSKKFATTEEVAKKLEDTATTAKKIEKPKKERPPERDENNAEAVEQDEWKDYEEDKKDYSGLKIGNLTIGANQENSQLNQEPGCGDGLDGNESGQESDRKAGPWRRIDVQPEPVQEEPPRPPEKKPEPVVVAAAAAATAPSSTSKAYVPPSMRNQGAPSAAPPLRQRGGPKGVAPDIHNEEFFPTLSKSGDGKKNKSEGSFEVVQANRKGTSYRQQIEQSKSSGGPQLNLGNRYHTLSNDS